MADVSRLPGPNADLWDWQLEAACRGEDSDLFFHPEGERGPSRLSRELAAKSVCARCPVIAQCAAHAQRGAASSSRCADVGSARWRRVLLQLPRPMLRSVQRFVAAR